MRTRHAATCLVVLAAVVGAVSCAVTDPTQYYTLGLPPAAGGARVAIAAAGAAALGPVSIGVGPVIMPAYLDRVQMVTRSSADQVEISTFTRWAEPLEDGIARVLGDEIGASVPTERIATFPWRGVAARAIQYQVVVAVLRFDGRPDGDVVLDARWRILGRDGAEVAFRRSTLTEPTGGPGVMPMVAAMTRALAALGREIAAEIRTKLG